MSYFVGLDVSVKLTAICIVDDCGMVVMERVVASDPGDIGRCIEEIDGEVGRIGLEAGPLAPWLFGGLAERASRRLYRGPPDESVRKSFAHQNG